MRPPYTAARVGLVLTYLVTPNPAGTQWLVKTFVLTVGVILITYIEHRMEIP